MASEVKIPALGESITSGILAEWRVGEGDYVEKDQPIFELETDKITSEGLAEVSGTISLKAAPGDEVEIGQVVAVIDESVKPTENGGEATPEKPTDKADKAGTEAEAPEAKSAPPATPAAETTANTGHPLSPAARKAAAESGVDTSTITGSGKDGRVTKGDIQAVAKETEPTRADQPSEPSAAETADKASGETREVRKRMTPLRRKIAERLVTATNEAALLTTFNEVDMSAVMQLRKRHQDEFVEAHGIKLGFMSFFVKAVTAALKAVPGVNGRIEGNEIVQYRYYDIGVAVGTDKGLMVPVVRDCDRKSFAGIEQDILAYAKAARDGKIQLTDLEGGVFTISNGGIYGSMLSTPIVNHPQSAILGLHNIQQRPVVVDGEIVARPMMYLALSYDHRLIDGKEAVTFLVTIKKAIENPERMLFGL